MQTQRWGQAGSELDQRVTHQRPACLQRDSHAHTIDLEKDIVGPIALEVRVLLLIKATTATAGSEKLQEPWIESRNTLAFRYSEQIPHLVVVPESLPACLLHILGQGCHLQ